MHFIATLSSFLLLSAVTATPISKQTDHPQSRDLCQVGIPCTTRVGVDQALTSINNAVSIIASTEHPITTDLYARIFPYVQQTADTLSSTNARLKADLDALNAEAEAALQSAVLAAVDSSVVAIKLAVKELEGLNDALTALIGEAMKQILKLEALVGECT